MFALVKSLKLAPQAIGEQLGEHLTTSHTDLFTKFNIIKGFLNLSVADTYWTDLLQKNYQGICFGRKALNGKKVMVEYSSPNTK
jgi:arginyl-tRNA synthetase